MTNLFSSPIYPSFDNEGCQFLGTVMGMGHLFDLYISESVVDGLKEILAVPFEHEMRGPICMEASLCRTYKEGHPLHVAWYIANQKNLL